jgi:diguanylate cyclase (GGDEF)-like protein/PAS domain S-box-containing protein
MDNILVTDKEATNALLNAIGSLVVVFDIDDRIVSFNRACEDTTGYRFAEVKGHSIQDLFISSDDTHFSGRYYHDHPDDENPVCYTNYWQTLEGSKRLIAWSNLPLKDNLGNITHILATGTDITEQRLGEDQIMRSSEHQEILNQLLRIGIDDIPLDEKLKLALKNIMTVSWDSAVVEGYVYMIDAESGSFVLKHEEKSDPSRVDSTMLTCQHQAMCKKAMDNGQIEYIEAAGLNNDQDDDQPADNRACYCIPVKSRNTIPAVLLLFMGDSHTQDVREIVFLRTIANTLASIIENYLAQEALSKSQSNLANAQQIAHMGSWEWSRHTGKLYCSDESLNILGLDSDVDSTSYRSFINHLSADDKTAVLQAIRAAIRHGEDFMLDLRIVHADDSEHFVILQGAVKFDDNGKVIRLFGAIQDMTDRLIAERELQLVASVFDSAQESIMVTDAENRILRVNRAFTTITGFPAKEIIGKNPDTLNSEQHDTEFYEQMWSIIREKGIWRGEVWNRKKSGEIYPEWRTISTVHDERGEIIRYISIAMDLSDKKVAEERIHRLAHYDALTQLPNRSMFKTLLTRECATAHRQKQKLAVLFIGLDGLKRINESIGHNNGDKVLNTMSTRLTKCVRGDDTVARWGGDEFSLILSDLKHPEDAVIVAHKILNVLIEPITLPDQENIVISASIGISLCPDDDDNSMTLIQNADMAMFKAKEKGGNCYQFYTAEMNIAVIEKLSLETGLRSALELDQFELYYQPIMNLETRAITGAEALLRWNHPKRGLVPPDQFIPVAEDSGLIIPIGEWVINQACKQCKAWHALGYDTLKISANLSARQFRNNNLVNAICDALNTSGLDPSLLTLELTESSIMDNAEETIKSLHVLKNTGVRLSIDDFGTGYSSLAYLKRFPIDYLKIDRSFVLDVDNNADDRTIVQTIIAMGHSMKLSIVAEGIEKIEHMNFLNEQHCDEVQGYFISRPIPADGFLEFLQRWQLEITKHSDSPLRQIKAI